MTTETWIRAYWQAAVQKHDEALLPCFTGDAVIRWHNTNEQFTPQEYIRANSAYPGNWQHTLERFAHIGSTVITAVRVYGEMGSFHATSFFTLRDGLIAQLDEYWGDDGPPPTWRQELHIGKPIR